MMYPTGLSSAWATPPPPPFPIGAAVAVHEVHDVVPTGGETQHPAHGAERELGPVRLHERVPPPGIDPLSFANQATAIFWDVPLRPEPPVLTTQMRHLAPRFRRQPVTPFPLVQLRLLDPVADRLLRRDRTPERALRPDRASSTSRSRYSGGYRPAPAATTHFLGWPNGKVSVRAGQLQSETARTALQFIVRDRIDRQFLHQADNWLSESQTVLQI